MTDHVSPKKRSQIMAAVKSKNTASEYIVRKLLHAAGYRYRLHDKKLSGKPDIIFKKYKAVIFVHGCFWHGHGCHLSKKLPLTRTDFWRNKIEKNKERDEKVLKELISQGWRVCWLWECTIKRKYKLEPEQILSKINRWLHSPKKFMQITSIKKGISK